MRGKRSVDIPANRLRTIPWVEIFALLLTRFPMNKDLVWHWRNCLFQKIVPQSEIDAADVVVGFDTAAWIIGQRAKKAGKKFVLDQSVGHPLSRSRTVMESGGNAEMWPEAFVPRSDVVQEAEAQEHALADLVVAASSFSRKTLVENGVAETKIRVLPYGVGSEFVAAGAARFNDESFDVVANERSANENAPRVTKPFRFLYAGYLTRRKGIGVLLDAWAAEFGGSNVGSLGSGGPMTTKKARYAELRLLGGGQQPQPLPTGVICLGQTPRHQLLREMEEADVFVFPSLFEGFALVILEAMASGLAVITTPNTAGPDLIEDGKDGLIVPVGDALSLKDAMKTLISCPDRAKAMGRAAHEKAKEYTWEKYGQRWEGMLHELCS
jgi:glycosyltransferase involved in cell wall biosynthesis